MKKWEYFVLEDRSIQNPHNYWQIICNNYGYQGWELVSVVKEEDLSRMFFKREKDESMCGHTDMY